MTWIKCVFGGLCVLVGLVWIGQGVNQIPGSFMTGQPMWAVIGAIRVAVGAWLLSGVAGMRRT